MAAKGIQFPRRVVRGYDLRKPGGHLGNVGSYVSGLPGSPTAEKHRGVDIAEFHFNSDLGPPLLDQSLEILSNRRWLRSGTESKVVCRPPAVPRPAPAASRLRRANALRLRCPAPDNPRSRAGAVARAGVDRTGQAEHELVHTAALPRARCRSLRGRPGAPRREHPPSCIPYHRSLPHNRGREGDGEKDRPRAATTRSASVSGGLSQ